MMSISEQEQLALESIENDLASTGPQLASMLTIFARLTAGEEMPARERIRRTAVTHTASTKVPAAGLASRPDGLRWRGARLGAWSVWLIVFAAAIASIAVAVTIGARTGKGTCPPWQAAACRQAMAPAPSNGGAAPGRARGHVPLQRPAAVTRTRPGGLNGRGYQWPSIS